MDAEVLIWTLVFFGGTIAVVLTLMGWAIRKDRAKSRAPGADDADG